MTDDKLIEEAADAIEKIQGLGYIFTFDLPTQTYQACTQGPNGELEAIHTYKNLPKIIDWVDENIP